MLQEKIVERFSERTMAGALSATIIGSFRQYYKEVLDVLRVFQRGGIEVLSPIGSSIIQPGISFVRFFSDPTQLDDAMVQTMTMEKILRLSDFTYVIAPSGYVGRTTCYEIGRIVQAAKPIYFSLQPNDLPLQIPNTHIISALDLVASIHAGTFTPQALFLDEADEYNQVERRLIYGH